MHLLGLHPASEVYRHGWVPRHYPSLDRSHSLHALLIVVLVAVAASATHAPHWPEVLFGLHAHAGMDEQPMLPSVANATFQSTEATADEVCCSVEAVQPVILQVLLTLLTTSLLLTKVVAAQSGWLLPARTKPPPPDGGRLLAATWSFIEMRKRHLLSPGVALAALALLVAPTLASQPTPNPGAAQIETEFLMGMVPHHRSAVAMAQMVSEKATHQELKTLAQSIVDNQNREIAQMSQWLRDWYGMDPPSGTSMPNSGMQDMMPMLHDRMPDMDAGMLDLQSKSGSDFETAFLSDMSHHHAMAIMMTGPVLMGGNHAELFTLAENIAISQGQEIKQMGGWLQSWYGLDRPLDRPTMSMSAPMPMQPVSPMPMDMGD